MRSIIAATDFSERSAIAIRRAAALAKTRGINLTLLHAINPKGFFGRLLGSGRIEPTIEEIGSKLLAKLDELGVSGEARVESGAPGEVIARAAEEQQASLIALGDHGEFHMSELLLGTTAQKAIENADMPIWVIKNGGEDPYKKVLIATDFSPCAREAASFALELFPDAEYAIFSAYLAPSDIAAAYYGVATDETESMLETMRAETVAELEEFRNALPFPKERTKIIARASASPSETVVEIAQSERSDLIVMGTKGMSAKISLTIGSTTESVLRRSPIDMLILKR